MTENDQEVVSDNNGSPENMQAEQQRWLRENVRVAIELDYETLSIFVNALGHLPHKVADPLLKGLAAGWNEHAGKALQARNERKPEESSLQ